MEFILDITNYTSIWVWLGVSILLGAGYVVVRHRSKDKMTALQMGLVLAAVLAYIITFGTLLWNISQETVRRETIATELQETYSVFPSDRQVVELKYPAEQPTGGFQEYGSFQRDNGEEAVLVWTGDEFQLGTMKGERFTEFERVDG